MKSPARKNIGEQELQIHADIRKEMLTIFWKQPWKENDVNRFTLRQRIRLLGVHHREPATAVFPEQEIQG